MTECICQSSPARRIGIIYVPTGDDNQFKVAWRFALNCPVHGIESDRNEVEQDFDNPKTAKQMRAARQRRKRGYAP